MRKLLTLDFVRPCLGAILFLCVSLTQATLLDNQIERIEPANWWVGMKSPELQLMVHGKNIATFDVQLNYAGVTLKSVQRVTNSNYLFINLVIDKDAKAGTLPLRFIKGDVAINQAYELQSRAPQSAQRRGFSNADVIINIMPDRFSNGDTTNDNVAGYADKYDRKSDEKGRHGGDILGIQNHLDYLAAMGYTMIWPTPLVENNQPTYSYHGYAATDTYKIDARFGSNQDYKNMVAAAKQKGIGVIQDIVLNHIGSNHWWMHDMPSADWLSYDGKFIPTLHMMSTVNDPYASKSDKENLTSGWFNDSMPDMNQKNPLVATYQIQNAIWWVEYADLSGIRVDTYGYSDPTFLTNWSSRLMDEYPNFNIVGEVWSMNPVLVSYWQKGKVNANGYMSPLPSLMDFTVMDTLRNALIKPESQFGGLYDLYTVLTSDTVYPNVTNLVLFEGNHDLSRIYTEFDQDAARVKMAVAYVATMNRIPQLYYGTEVLMTSKKGKDDGATRKDFPGGWAGDKVNAFTGQGLTPAQKDVQQFVKKLFNWRKNQDVIHHGKLMHFVPQDGTYTYFRYDDKKVVMIVLNKNKKDVTLPTERFSQVLPASAKGVDVIGGQPIDLSKQVVVPAKSVLIIDVDK